MMYTLLYSLTLELYRAREALSSVRERDMTRDRDNARAFGLHESERTVNL